MNYWLEIDASPPLQIAVAFESGGGMAKQKPRHALLGRVSPIRSSASDGGEAPENANLTVDLPNRYGQAARLFQVPPLGASARLVLDGVIAFSGVVSDVVLDDEATLTVQA